MVQSSNTSRILKEPEIFHGNDKKTHEDFQKWRREHLNGFHMTEGLAGKFTIHWTQDKRENALGRGCHHQGGSGNKYQENGCYTTARKVCSEELLDLLVWAAKHHYEVKSCTHCGTERFPFPVRFAEATSMTSEALEGQREEAAVFKRYRNPKFRDDALKRADGVCESCRTDFSKVLGGAGRAVLQVHHIVPLASRQESGEVTRLEDLAVLCSNCHALIHAFGSSPLSVEELLHLLQADTKSPSQSAT